MFINSQHYNKSRYGYQAITRCVFMLIFFGVFRSFRFIHRHRYDLIAYNVSFQTLPHLVSHSKKCKTIIVSFYYPLPPLFLFMNDTIEIDSSQMDSRLLDSISKCNYIIHCIRWSRIAQNPHKIT